MASRRLIVIGASSGGIEALQVIARALPRDLPAAVCVVIHTAADSPGMLESILRNAGRLRASTATTGMRLDDSAFYVAPPDHHLIVEPGALMVTKGPRENRFRPAIDPLFRSAAQVFGPAAIGVVLTGGLDDGTAGLWAIKRCGGIAIVQDPADAMYPSMPANAARHVEVDYRVPLDEMVPLLARLVAAPIEYRELRLPEPLEVEVKIAKEVNAIDAGVERIGGPSRFSCPECHGVLLQLKDAQPLRFRCHTGHAYSVESLVAAVSEGIDEALWTAVRSLEEAGLLLQHVAQHFAEHTSAADAPLLADHARDVHRQAEAVRAVATERNGLTTGKS